jgi:hypothetical protein
MTTTAEQLEQWRGRKVVDVDGEDIGKLEDVYYTVAGEPVLARIASGLLGRHHALVPLDASSVGRDYMRVGFRKAQIEQVGSADVGEVLDADEASTLGSAYGVSLPGAGQGLESSAQIAARRAQAAVAENRAAQLEDEAHKLDEDAAARRARATEASATASDAEQDAADARRDAEAARERAEAASEAARRGLS